MSTDIRKPSINTKPYAAISPEALKNTLTGRVVVITGAGGGLGRGECQAFAKAGAKLALIDLDRAGSALQVTADQCIEQGAEVKTYFCNVIDAEESRKTWKQIEADLGEVDVLVNNAGGYWISFAFSWSSD